MSDDLMDRLREVTGGKLDYTNTPNSLRLAARDRIEELEAKLAKAVRSLTVIDALDPEGFVNGCSQSALKGLVLRMGEVARTTLTELKRPPVK